MRCVNYWNTTRIYIERAYGSVCQDWYQGYFVRNLKPCHSLDTFISTVYARTISVHHLTLSINSLQAITLHSLHTPIDGWNKERFI